MLFNSETFDILKHPHHILSSTSKDINESDYSKFVLIGKKMIKTLKRSGGVGLAANQVGLLDRIIIALINDKYITMINPVISDHLGCIDSREGCLSIPNNKFDVERFKHITVKYIDHNLKAVSLDLSDFESTIIQHEIDHLNGITLKEK